MTDRMVRPSPGCLGLLLASVAGASLPALAADPLALADARDVFEQAREVRRAGFASARQRFVTWIEAGNLMLAREPDFRQETLVAGAAGEAIRGAYPAEDGRTVFYTSGGHRAPFGSIPGRDTRRLWRIDAEGDGPPRLVARGDEVPAQFVPAPDGEALAFSRGNVLYELRHDGNGQWRRRQLLESDARHEMAVGIEDIVYSPDAARIAFVSVRKAGQSYIGVHDVATGETRYIEPGIFRDRLPAWAPDGSALAFVRVPGNWTMEYRFTPQREGVPWSIVSADAGSGAARTVWTAAPGPGSVAQTMRPIWTADGRILFTWEKTGWNLLYAVPAHGGAARLLAPGEGETGRTALSPDGLGLVYETNVGDLSRRHLWSVRLDGSPPVQLTSGQGVEGNPGFSAGGYLSYSSENRFGKPPQLVIRRPEGDVLPLAFGRPDVEARKQQVWSRFLPVETVSIRTADGLVGHHVLVKPGSAPPAGGYPVIVAAHGGPATRVMPNAGPYAAFGQYVASRGYLLVDLNYRGSSGFGLDYRLPEGRGATGGSEAKDLDAVLAYLGKRGDVDPGRIGIMGSSYGGYLVGLAMTRPAGGFAAGVSLYGVSDWVLEMKKDQEDQGWRSAPPPYIRLSERVRIEDLAYASSPSARIENWRAPALFTIGEIDKAGHIEAVVDMGYRLLARGVPVEFFVDPGGGHDVFPQEKVFEFFEKHLRREHHGRSPCPAELASPCPGG